MSDADDSDDLQMTMPESVERMADVIKSTIRNLDLFADTFKELFDQGIAEKLQKSIAETRQYQAASLKHMYAAAAQTQELYDMVDEGADE